MTARDAHQSPTEFKDIILSYPTIKKVMADPHYEILWADNSGAGLGSHPTENYGAGIYYTPKQAIIYQNHLR